MLAFAVMPAVIFSIADGVRRYHTVVAERDRLSFQSAMIDAQETRDALSALRAVTTTLADSDAVAAFREPACSDELARADAQGPELLLAVAVDASGAPRCASRPLGAAVTFADDASFRAIAADPAFDLAVRRSGRVSGREVLVASAPILRDGAFGGVVSVSIAASALRFLAQPDGAAPPMRAIVDHEGRVLVGAGGGDDMATGWLPAGDLASLLAAQQQTSVGDSADGARRVFSVTPFVRDRAWLVAAVDAASLSDDAVLRALPSIVTPLLMLAIAVAVAYLALDRLVVRHLVYLARLTRAYGRGRLDLTPRGAANAPQELASLADSLGAMAASLAARQRELRDSAETRRVLLLEIHHRVRNNLQMLASMTNLQARMADAAAPGRERAALERVRSRIHSVVLVHEQMHQGDAVDRLDLGALIDAVASGMTASVNATGGAADGGHIRLQGTYDPISASPDRATILALFVDEAMALALRQARNAGASTVAVTLCDDGGGAFTLRISHDAPPHGDGAAEGWDGASGAADLERRLIEGLARQLRATLQREDAGGRQVLTLRAPAPVGAIRSPA